MKNIIGFLLFLILLPIIGYSEDNKVSHKNFENKPSIGFSYGENLSLSLNWKDLAFPNYEHKRFRNQLRYLNCYYVLVPLNNNLKLKFSINFYDFNAGVLFSYMAVLACNFNIELQTFDLDVMRIIFRKRFFECYLIFGLSSNKINYSLVKNDVSKNEILILKQSKSGVYNGVNIGLSIVLFNDKKISVPITIENKYIYINKWEDFGIFLNFGISYKI